MTSKRKLKNYVRENYILGRGYKGDVYNSIDLGHLRTYDDVDKYISSRFNVAKFPYK